MKRFGYRGLLLSLAFSVLLLDGWTGQAAAAEELVFASWGGAYQEAIRKAWLEPFSKESGIEVLEDTSPDMSKIKAMVETNTVSWDVVTGGGFSMIEGIGQGLFEKLPADKINQQHVYPDARNDYGVPSEIFSTLFAFNLKTFPDGKPQPQSWADFWDVKKFPGKRAFYGNRPSTCLEIALLADGVAKEDVYKVLKTKEGVDRAFAKIEALKPHVALWWKSGAAPVQALGSMEVVMATGWNGRFQAGINEGLPLRMVWNGAIAQVGYFQVVKNAPNKENAFKFLNHMISPKAQAEFHKYVAYGPTTAEAWQYIPKSQWERLPSSPQNLEKSVFLSESWWAPHYEALLERWQTMLSQ
jgi:putative spermidine/putrescine transport system substrate-binding protein